MEKADKLKIVKDSIPSYADFPVSGILFRDVFGIFKNVAAMEAMRDLIVDHVALMDVDFIVGLDSRGFLLGPLVSLALAKPFIPIRKQGKLPGKVIQQVYVKEYGEDVFEIQAGVVQGKCNRAIILDDLIATGGTLAAAEQLLKTAGATVVECLVIMELKSLKGHKKLEAPLYSLIQYD